MSVNSFDVFDTLIARTVREPEDVFSIVEQTFPYPGFRRLRTTAQYQLGLCNLNQIYENLQRIAGISQELTLQLQTAELMAEYRVSIPIRSVLNLVQDGDILISDMYLSGDTILWLLKKHGFNRKVLTHVTPQGKRTGESYRHILAHHKIHKHYGDNAHSDIAVAANFGIQPVHITVSAPNATENLLLNNGLDATANLLRTFRLASPSLETPTIWLEQARDNIPFLFYMARQLKHILDTEKRSALYFITRDGCLLHQVFSLLYPSVETHILYSSRVVHRNPSADYKSYLKSIYKGRDASLLFDLHGGFASGRELYQELFGHYPRVHIGFPIPNPILYDGLTFESNRSTAAWEVYNCDIMGTLVNYDAQFGPVYAPNEFDVGKCKEVHEAFTQFMSLFKKADIDKVRREIETSPSAIWLSIMNSSDNAVHCRGVTLLVLSSLNELANRYHSDKGDSYICAHNYVLHYERIFHTLDHRFDCRLNLLEIGLNRDNSSDVPSLKMFRDYFANRINLTGFDINPDFLKFSDIAQIVIGDQSKPEDLAKVKSKDYHIIIDDGYHASRHQQVSLAALWESVASGGCYVIEDLHYQPIVEPNEIKTKELLLAWAQGNYIDSSYVKANDIMASVAHIEFSDSHSKAWDHNLLKNAFAVLWKK